MKCLLRVASLLFLTLLISIHSFGQEELDKLLKESAEDGRVLIEGYLSPFMKSISLGLNQGWYNTAKPHKIAGIDITVSANLMTVPEDELFYDVARLNLKTLELSQSSPDYPFAPTIFGPDREPLYRIKENSQTFEGPPGLDIKGNIGSSMVPVPVGHIGIGLPKNTDLKIRFTPDIEFGDNSKLKIFGFGVLHDLKQWIPGMTLMPFDLSGFVGYTHFKMTTQFNPDDPQDADQEGIFEMNATTVQGLISKKFSIVTVYGGIGYNVARSNIAMKGRYDINEDGDKDDEFETNPVDLKFSASGPRATAGIRLKLAILTLHADYTLQKYKCFSAGVGISIR